MAFGLTNVKLGPFTFFERIIPEVLREEPKVKNTFTRYADCYVAGDALKASKVSAK
jgi:hypothetical protein